MESERKTVDPEKLYIALGYCLERLKPFKKKHPFSSSAKQLAPLVQALEELLAKKRNQIDSLTAIDLKEIEQGLNRIHNALIKVPKNPAMTKFLNVFKEIVLTIENHEYYNHISDAPITKPKHPYLKFDNQSKPQLIRNQHNLQINRMIGRCDYLAIVYISTEAYNPWGHVALKLGDQGYVHVNTLTGKPKFYTPDQWRYYMQKGGYGMMGIEHIPVPHMELARKELEDLAKQKWHWNPRSNNCTRFAQTIVKKGGGNCEHLENSVLPVRQLANVPLARLIGKPHKMSVNSELILDQKAMKTKKSISEKKPKGSEQGIPPLKKKFAVVTFFKALSQKLQKPDVELPKIKHGPKRF